IVLTLYYGFVCTIGFLYTPHRLDNRLFPYTTLFRSLDFLPESHTDFIIAVLAEEFGLLGVCLLLLLYVLIVARGLYIASQAQDTYPRLAAGCIAITFFVYVFVNIGMVSGLLPVVGVPLPLISYGGTSALTLMAGFGILMSIHTHKKMLTR